MSGHEDILPFVEERRVSSRFAEGSRRMLGIGSLAFAVWSLVDPRGLARVMGDDPAYARALGIRDGVIGLTLLTSRFGRPALVARLAADLSDAVRLASRSPRVAAGACAFAAWAALALLHDRRRA